MRRYIKPISVCTLLSFLPWLTGYAAGEREGLGFTTYYFSDSGDNSVVTTSFKLAKKLLENTLFLIDIELDQVTVPAVTAVTGATRPQRRKNEPFEKNRGQIIVGVQQGLGDNASFAGNFYRSQEIDYVSNAFVGIFSHDLNDKNTTVTLRGQYNADLVGKILDDGDIVNQRKKTYNGSFNLSQILSPNTVMDVSYDFVLHKGFQSDPYRQVRVLDGTGASITVDELHPNSRTRHAAAMKLSQFIAPIKASVIGSYRYYFDSWKVKSHTGEVKFNKYILNDLVFDLGQTSLGLLLFNSDRLLIESLPFFRLVGHQLDRNVTRELPREQLVERLFREGRAEIAGLGNPCHVAVIAQQHGCDLLLVQATTSEPFNQSDFFEDGERLALMILHERQSQRTLIRAVVMQLDRNKFVENRGRDFRARLIVVALHVTLDELEQGAKTPLTSDQFDSDDRITFRDGSTDRRLLETVITDRITDALHRLFVERVNAAGIVEEDILFMTFLWPLDDDDGGQRDEWVFAVSFDFNGVGVRLL